jgi:hypothetical protein
VEIQQQQHKPQKTSARSDVVAHARSSVVQFNSIETANIFAILLIATSLSIFSKLYFLIDNLFLNDFI